MSPIKVERTNSSLRWTLLLLYSLLSACGFHLRGNEAFPSILSELKLECSNTQYWHFCSSLRGQLRLNQVTLSGKAALTLVIDQVESNQRVLSLHKNASAAEYRQIQTVQYRLLATTSQQQITQQTATADRSYQNDSLALLAQERESDDIRSEMNTRLVETIIRQISVYSEQRIDEILSKINQEP